MENPDLIAIHNAQVKALAGLFMALGITIILAGAARVVSGETVAVTYWVFAAGLAVWSLSLVVLRYLRAPGDQHAEL